MFNISASCSSYCVLLVPDYQQSPLEATIVKNKHTLPFCKNKWDYFDIWFKLSNFKLFMIECWASAFRLHYDSTHKKVYSTPGVEIRPRSFGSVYEVEDNTMKFKSRDKEYMKYLVESLVGIGYLKNQNLLAATYDWRLAPYDNPEFAVYFGKLIELTYMMNYKRGIILTCHGVGCLYAHHFLINQDGKWKVKYIKSLIAIGGPWGGSFTNLYKYLGEDDSLLVATLPDIRLTERTFSMTSLLLPSMSTFKHNVLIHTMFRNYTAADYRDIFLGLGYPNAFNMWIDSHAYSSTLKHPGVDVFIVNGIGYKTMESIHYKKAIDLSDEKGMNKKTKRKISYGNGDGVVNLASSRRVLCWQDSPDASYFKFHYTEFLAKHDNLIKETHPVSHIINIVSSLKYN